VARGEGLSFSARSRRTGGLSSDLNRRRQSTTLKMPDRAAGAHRRRGPPATAISPGASARPMWRRIARCLASAARCGGTCRDVSRWNCCSISTRCRPFPLPPNPTRSPAKRAGTDPFLSTPVRSAVAGQRMRADICAALLHELSCCSWTNRPWPGRGGQETNSASSSRHINREHGHQRCSSLTHRTCRCREAVASGDDHDHGRLLYGRATGPMRERFGGKRELGGGLCRGVRSDISSRARSRRARWAAGVYRFGRETDQRLELISACLSARYRIRDLSVRRAGY